jgi:hypothetical protein
LDGPAAPGCPAHPRRHRNRSSAPAKCPKRNHSSKFPVLVTPGGVTSVKMRPYSYVPAWPNFQLVLGFDASAPIFVWHIGVFPGCLCAQGVWVDQSVDRRLSSSVLVPPAGGSGQSRRKSRRSSPSWHQTRRHRSPVPSTPSTTASP